MIRTKKNSKGNWICYGTINGYDYSFEATTVYHAKKQMRDLIHSIGKDPKDFSWEISLNTEDHTLMYTQPAQ